MQAWCGTARQARSTAADSGIVAWALTGAGLEHCGRTTRPRASSVGPLNARQSAWWVFELNCDLFSWRKIVSLAPVYEVRVHAPIFSSIRTLGPISVEAEQFLFQVKHRAVRKVCRRHHGSLLRHRNR